MPKINVDDDIAKGWRTEVSWRREEHLCRCGCIWSAPVDSCPECGKDEVPITSGHVQVATVNQAMPFEYAGEPFDGWHVTLDREGIDRLVGALTRARDAAYPTWVTVELPRTEPASVTPAEVGQAVAVSLREIQ